MNLSVTVTASTRKELAAALLQWANEFEGQKAMDASPAQDVPAPTKTTKTKAKKEVEETFGLDEEEEKEETVKAITKSDLIEALRSFAATHTTGKARDILTKFKVKSVHDIKESDYEKVMKALSLKK